MPKKSAILAGGKRPEGEEWAKCVMAKTSASDLNFLEFYFSLLSRGKTVNFPKQFLTTLS
jgi:hypothetical protein